jgi:hypothetical protein
MNGQRKFAMVGALVAVRKQPTPDNFLLPRWSIG